MDHLSLRVVRRSLLAAFVVAVVFLGLAAAAGAAPPIFGEDHWQASYPFGAPADLRAVAALDGTTAYVVGDDGAVWLTEDAGRSWVDRRPASSVDLHAVAFTSTSEGWVAGEGGILHTVNGGLAWTAQTDGATGQINDLFFLDAMRGWAVGDGGVILHTVNGGETWVAQPSITTNSLNALWVDTNAVGWAVGDGGVILRTGNGGDTWEAKPSLSTVDLNGVTTAGDARARVVGDDGTYLYTWTDGDYWMEEEISEEARALDLHAITYTEAPYFGAITVGEGGVWSYSFWQTFVQMDVTSRLLDVAETSGVFWAVGRHGAVVRSESLGDGWEDVAVPSDAPALNDLCFLDDDMGWVVGDGGAIARTDDGGASWQTQDSEVAFDLYGVAFRDELHGWAVGAEATRLKTSDGGGTWTLVGENGGGRPSYRDVAYAPRESYPGEDRLWIAGDGRTLLRSSDGGDSWGSVYPAELSTYGYDKLSVPAEAVMYGGGQGAAGLSTTDFGVTVNTVDALADSRDISFSTAMDGWWIPASAATGVRRTIDGGKTWAEVILSAGDLGPEPLAIAAATSEVAYVAGEDGRLWRIQPLPYGELGRFNQTSGVPVDLLEVQALDGDHVWAVGRDGTVLHSSDGGQPDFLAPVTDVSPGLEDRYYNTPVTLSFTAVDDRSGVARTEYCVNLGEWEEGDSVTFHAPADHSGDGTFHIQFRSTDNAGNVEAARVVQVRIDTVAPAVSVSSEPADLLGYWINVPLTLTFTVTDETSRVGRAPSTW